MKVVHIPSIASLKKLRNIYIAAHKDKFSNVIASGGLLFFVWYSL